MAFRRIKRIVTSHYVKWGIAMGISYTIATAILFGGLIVAMLLTTPKTETSQQTQAIPVINPTPAPTPKPTPEPGSNSKRLSFGIKVTANTLTSAKTQLEQKLDSFSKDLSKLIPNIEPQIYYFDVSQEADGSYEGNESITLNLPNSTENEKLEEIAQTAQKYGAVNIDLSIR